MPSPQLMLALGLAGALGAVTRFALVEWIAPRWQGTFPLSTLIVKLTGAFALGFLMAAGGTDAPLASLRLLLGTGFLGGYTTFSTLTFETHMLARDGLH